MNENYKLSKEGLSKYVATALLTIPLIFTGCQATSNPLRAGYNSLVNHLTPPDIHGQVEKGNKDNKIIRYDHKHRILWTVNPGGSDRQEITIMQPR